MRKRVTILMAMSVILSGCQARSISNSGYPEDAPDAANSNLADRGKVDDFALPVLAESAPTGNLEIIKTLVAYPVVTGGE
jgi:hypothetical protein